MGKSTYNVFGMQDPFVLSFFADRDCPEPLIILFGLGDGRLGPDRELHGRGIPLHEKTKLLRRGVGWPVLGVGEVWEVVGPMGKVQG